ncbi:MAG: VWA-like domain-containing protein [Oscillospiraceae bacterium]|nr:VWA-like domain-containing protein [Oscillospiraceae bacterium]
MDEQTKKLKADLLAGEILQLAHASLLLHLRFMENALCRLSFTPMPKGSLWTDGKSFSYSPMYVLLRYKEERANPARDYLHCVLHCVFRHMYLHTPVEQQSWSLACDMVVEDLIADLNLRSAAVRRQEEQQAVLEAFRNRVKPFTAEKLYRFFLDSPLPEEERLRLEELFRADDHRAWFSSDNNRDRQNERNEDSPDLPEPNAPPMETEQEWRSVADSIEADLETISREAGDAAAGLRRALRRLNREKRDYAAFLRKFAVRGEVMQLDPAEFDWIYYTYGLQLYGNMPLIEPLEYREDLRIRSFVIAVDTSGSISEELVHAFLQKTFNILKASESFFSRVDVRILQCDLQIQDEVRISSTSDLDAALKGLTLKGFGGTDFRPVFDYIERQRQAGELPQLRGLLYFTDGCGIFPQKAPGYDTAFVFLENEGNQYEVPPWAIRLTLEPEEILEDV